MKINLLSVNKAPNSTYRPKATRDYEVYLKEDTDILNPVFRISLSVYFALDTSKLLSFNYVIVPSWNRYYYVTNIKIVNRDIGYIYCTEDVLATWKDDIAVSDMVIVRSPNGNDNCYETNIPLSKYERVSVTQTPLFTKDGSTPSTGIGIYLDVAGKAESGCNPTTTTYFMNVGSLKHLLEKVYSPETYSAGAVMDLVSQTICNPSQYIVGCRVGRLEVHDEAPVTSIKFGWLDIPIEGCYKVQSGMYTYIINREITFPTVSNDVPYQYALYIPTIGQIEVERSSAGTMTIECNIDMATGVMYVQVRDAKGKIIHCANGQALVPMPITGVVASLPSTGSLTLGAVSTLADTIADMGTGKSISKQTRMDFGKERIDSLVNSWKFLSDPNPTLDMTPTPATTSVINTAVEAFESVVNKGVQRQVKTMGGSGTLAELFAQKYIKAFTYIRDRLSNVTIEGKADYRVGKVSAVGYYKATYIELNSTAWAGERNEIVNHVKSGFYYE